MQTNAEQEKGMIRIKLGILHSLKEWLSQFEDPKIPLGQDSARLSEGYTAFIQALNQHELSSDDLFEFSEQKLCAMPKLYAELLVRIYRNLGITFRDGNFLSKALYVLNQGVKSGVYLRPQVFQDLQILIQAQIESHQEKVISTSKAAFFANHKQPATPEVEVAQCLIS